MRGIRKAFGATVALDGVDLAVGARRGVRARRPERRRQEHADGDPRGRAAPDAGAMTLDGAAYAPRSPLDGAPRRRRDDLPGAVARAAPDRDGEHPARRRADAAAACVDRGASMRATATAALARARPPRHRARRARSATLSVAGAAARRDRARARGRLPRARARRADEQPGPRRTSQRLFALHRPARRRRGIAIVYISHFLEEVKAVADRFAVLRDGRNAGGGATRRHAAPTPSSA